MHAFRHAHASTCGPAPKARTPASTHARSQSLPAERGVRLHAVQQREEPTRSVYVVRDIQVNALRHLQLHIHLVTMIVLITRNFDNKRHSGTSLTMVNGIGEARARHIHAKPSTGQASMHSSARVLHAAPPAAIIERNPDFSFKKSYVSAYLWDVCLQGDREFAGFGLPTDQYSDCFIQADKLPAPDIQVWIDV